MTFVLVFFGKLSYYILNSNTAVNTQPSLSSFVHEIVHCVFKTGSDDVTILFSNQNVRLVK